MAKDRDDNKVVEEVDGIAQGLFGVEQEATIKSFTSFVGETKEALKDALKKKKKIIFVMGHKNPDSDTVISSLAEAYRNNLINEDKDVIYVPVVQGSKIPDEIRRLLGDELSDSTLLTDNSDYEVAMDSGQARWILVDQNVSEVQRFAISVVDHHILSDKAEKQDITKTWEMAGSTAALIAQKFHGMGVDVDQGLARILYGATLMDTENRSKRKMTYKDGLIMDDLKEAASVEEDDEFYQDLMSYLLNTDDAELLFNRDYKQDWGIFGFAVVKVKGAFSQEGVVIKEELLQELVELAEENNKNKNFPLTVIKTVDYLDDNKTVNRERIYLIFNEHVLPEFKDTMFEFISQVIRSEYGDKAEIEQTENSVDFWGVGDQLSRKVTAPFLEPVVEVFNEYYFSSSTNLYVKREFLHNSEEIERVTSELGIELSMDKEGRINNITYNEAKQLLDSLGLTIMSLPEYWHVLAEAEEIHDEQMLSHLRSSGFVELLDTVILDHQYTINHPNVKETDSGYDYEGKKNKVDIPEALPGLVYPEDIDLKTGFPKVVHGPDKYGEQGLWRYWSPDDDVCIPTRGHIFLLNQPAFDTKVHPDDALPNLGIRPCCHKVKPPKVKIITDDQGVRADIKK